MKNNNRLIAILGGMGPDASARLITRVVELSREIGGAENSDDYPNFVMQNVPVPDFFDNPELYEEGLSVLKQAVRKLARLKPDYFALACNTVHSVLPELQTMTNVPFLSLPKMVSSEIVDHNYRKVGLLATPLTYESGIYRNEFEESDVVFVEPSSTDKRELGKIVHMVLRGEFENARRPLLIIANKLVEEGAEAIVLGCTELPLVFPTNYAIPTISSVECLARNIVIKYYKKEAI